MIDYESTDKMVSHPDHYKSGKYEVIDIVDEFCKDLTGTEAVCTANAIKYVLRWKKKNGKQDLEKAIWYLQHLVNYLDTDDIKKNAMSSLSEITGIEPVHAVGSLMGIEIPEDVES